MYGRLFATDGGLGSEYGLDGMTIRDEYLQQVLKHTPDRLFTPNENASRAVLSYARQAIANERRAWWHTILLWLKRPLVSNWQRAGAGSLATALVVMLIFWQMVPEKETWLDTLPDRTFNTVKNNAVALMQDEKSSEQKAPSARLAERAEINQSQESSVATQPEHALSHGEQQSIAPDDEMAVTTEIASPQTSTSSADAVSGILSASQARDSRRQKTEVASPELTKAQPANKEAVLDITQLLELIKNEGGQSVAARDIEAGKLRLLKIDMQIATQANSATCLQVASVDASPDLETGYQVLIISTCDSSVQLVNSVADYNQQMQAWFQKLQKK